MDKIKVAEELLKIAKDLVGADKVASGADKVDSELKKLLKDVQSGKGVDPRALETMTDGEIMGAFLIPMLQGLRIRMKDMKGFSKIIKQGL